MSAPALSNEELRDSLKRCRPEVVAAALAYRDHGDTHLLPLIVTGVIERFVEPDLRPRLRDADDTLRLSEDLGLDSLTMMEIILLTEDVFRINISAEELRGLCTLGQVKTFIACKARGLPLPTAEELLLGNWALRETR
ncbi:acyl carrier protein [Synoicihabitans lomoniglobus]|uniref:Acyl carrier protein n=1 Tax=Synoicihabitans lomoniglobus TaxID=2909285 RepID=A0AAF0CSY0_9BACT|nr:acyl carrier protein [Opitutaceae bacterium LMO-M01]WED67489.1 acyl carrier protein [Opitutaceae bacterium LMO-M01]